MKNKKDKSKPVMTNPGGRKSTRARTAGGKKLDPQVMASAEQQALQGLKERTEEGPSQGGKNAAFEG